MNILTIVSFVLGFVVGIFIKNILSKIIKTINMVNLAKQITEDAKEKQEFSEKYNIKIDEK